MIDLRVGDFLAADPQALIERLAFEDMQRFQRNHAQQLRAWTITIDLLRTALSGWEAAIDFHIILEFAILRLGKRIDAVLVTPRGILVLEFKAAATQFLNTDRQQTDDYAIDLQDFHSASRNRPIVPVLVATAAQPAPTRWPLMLGGAQGIVLEASALSLAGLLRDIWHRLPASLPPINPRTWAEAAYRPVPGIIDAACTLYTRNGVAEIRSAGAPAHNLAATTDAILSAISLARREGQHIALFVTGTPGAGKTLCGLNAVFGAGREAGATFLTGNPTLVHVLREALARDDANGQPKRLTAARQRTEAAIQALPHFRDSYVPRDDAPSDRVIVIDEAQRAWDRAHATRKSLDRKVRLSDSEPGHLLDIMARHDDWAVVIGLIGGGQEIHDGEGGLAEWGAALATRPQWRVMTATAALTGPDIRQSLPALPGLVINEALHLDIPVRNIRSPISGAWADAVLRGQSHEASALAAADTQFPFRLTRDSTAMRAYLRHKARGLRRAGLLASSGAKRLRADGFGAELPHMDATAVARWFLDRWPDIRASDALETLATEFSCQGLEIDYAGLCWGGDFIRLPGQTGWRVRSLSGTRWNTQSGGEAIGNRHNAYRVLLTRARYETVIWVPRGNLDDVTRAPAEFDAIADYLRECGVVDMADRVAAHEASVLPTLF